MPNDPTKPETAAQITFERFTESTLNAVLRAASAHQLQHKPIVIGIIFNPTGGYGTTVTCGFAAVVKPFFTDCYRTHMQFMFDLWDPTAVKNNWQAIFNAVQAGTMPAGGCPGTFNKEGFLQAFQCWKDQGFPA